MTLYFYISQSEGLKRLEANWLKESAKFGKR